MVWESRNVCDAAKQRGLNEFEMQLGQSLPKCADVYPTSNGLIAIGKEADEYKTLVFEPNQNGTIDVYDTTDNEKEPVLLRRIASDGFKKVRGLLLFAEDVINHPKIRVHDRLNNNDNKARRIERFISERSSHNNTRVEGRRHYGATALLKQSGNCQTNEDAQRAVHSSLVRLCKGAEYSGYLYMILPRSDKVVCKNNRYDVTMNAACLDYTITWSRSCPTISYSRSCPTSTNKTSCPTAENRTNCPTRK
jgi:hypothetical protein